jgi:hypothetical protein
LSSFATGTVDILAFLALQALLEVAVARGLAIVVSIALVLARLDASRANHTRIWDTSRTELDRSFVDRVLDVVIDQIDTNPTLHGCKSGTSMTAVARNIAFLALAFSPVIAVACVITSTGIHTLLCA